MDKKGDLKIKVGKDSSFTFRLRYIVYLSVFVLVLFTLIFLVNLKNSVDVVDESESSGVVTPVYTEDDFELDSDEPFLYDDDYEIDDTGVSYTNIPCESGLKSYHKNTYNYITVSDLYNNKSKLIGQYVCVVGKVGRTGNKCFELVNPDDGGFVRFNFVCHIDPSDVKGQVVCLIGIVDVSDDDSLNIKKGHIIARGSDSSLYLEDNTSDTLLKLIDGGDDVEKK